MLPHLRPKSYATRSSSMVDLQVLDFLSSFGFIAICSHIHSSLWFIHSGSKKGERGREREREKVTLPTRTSLV
jgi:hypothetical protein